MGRFLDAILNETVGNTDIMDIKLFKSGDKFGFSVNGLTMAQMPDEARVIEKFLRYVSTLTTKDIEAFK